MTTEHHEAGAKADTTGRILDQGKQLVHEGIVRRVIVKRGDETLVHIPVIAIVITAVAAPWLVALGVVAALLSHCTISVQRVDQEQEPTSLSSSETTTEPDAS